jgi:hypothetical protein
MRVAQESHSIDPRFLLKFRRFFILRVALVMPCESGSWELFIEEDPIQIDPGNCSPIPILGNRLNLHDVFKDQPDGSIAVSPILRTDGE